MALYNLIRRGIVPVMSIDIMVNGVKMLLPKQLSLIFPIEGTVNTLGTKRIIGDYLKGDTIYKMSRGVHADVFLLRKYISFGEIVNIAKKESIYKQYSLLDACTIIAHLLKISPCRNIGETLILLESTIQNPIPTLCLISNSENTYSLYFSNMYSEMKCKIGDSLVFKPVK